jgi:hypothetical protein
LIPVVIEIIEDSYIQDPRIEHVGLVLAAELELGGTTGQLYIDSATALAVHHRTSHANQSSRHVF